MTDRRSRASNVSRPVLPLADGLPARRPGPDGAVQLGVRPPPRRHVRLPHRGHRRRARLRGVLRHAARGHALARASTGTRAPRSAVRSAPTASPSATTSTPTSPPSCSRPAAPTTATARPTSSTSATRRPAPRAAHPGYDGHCRELTDEQVAAYEAEGRKPVVRFRMPDQAITFDDLVRGEITFQPEHVPDYVLVRGNGHPLYTLVNPVDDALMEITHVLRGEDLLSSTPRQIALYDALAEIGVGTGQHPAVRPPALRHGPGQQEALQARPRVQPARLPRPRLPARGAAQLPGPAGLGDRRGPRHLLHGGDGRGVRDRPGQPEPGALRPQEGRGDQRHAPAGAAGRGARRAAGARTCRRPGCSATRSPTSSARCWPRPRRWCRSGWPRSPSPSTCSASSSSTRTLRARPGRRRQAARDEDGKAVVKAAHDALAALDDLGDRGDRRGAARGADRGARAQAAQRVRCGAGRRSPVAGSRRRSSSRWSCSAASGRWPG